MNEIPEQPDEIEIADDAGEADVEHLQFEVTKDLERRIDQYLTDRVAHLSRAGVQRIIEEGLVKVNGRVVKSSYRPRNGDKIVMVAPPEQVSELIPENIPLDIVYEDEHFLALNKQTDLIVHPARGIWTGTLVNGLVHYGKNWSTLNGNWRPGILHRLDRNTTGIMLVAKSDEAHWRLARQFENRTIRKTYMAICHGIPEFLGDVIDVPIGQDRKVRERQAVRKEENGGKQAITVYEVVETFEGSGVRVQGSGNANSGARSAPASSLNPELSTLNPFKLVDSPHLNDRKLPMPPGKFSMVKLSPKTGRTHQLRVHMSHIGYPMVGDTMYGGRIFEYGDFRFARQALHAYEITFVHPVTLETMTLAAPLPPDFERLRAILRGA